MAKVVAGDVPGLVADVHPRPHNTNNGDGVALLVVAAAAALGRWCSTVKCAAVMTVRFLTVGARTASDSICELQRAIML